MKNYIPKTKDDMKAMEYLKACKFSEVKADAPLLLTYMQDMHWEVAHSIGEFFSPHVNELKPVLLDILNSNDQEWKFGILRGLIAKSNVKLDPDLLQTLKRMAFSPTLEEVSEELDLVSQQIVANNP